MRKIRSVVLLGAALVIFMLVRLVIAEADPPDRVSVFGAGQHNAPLKLSQHRLLNQNGWRGVKLCR